MISFVEVPIGSGGIAPCTRCSPDAGAGTPFPGDEVVSSIIGATSQACLGPGPNIRLAGFEPFMHPDLPRIIGAAAAAGAQRIQLRTDAGALVAQGNAAGALSAGVTHIEAVLLAGDASAHDDLTGTAGLFVACREALATCARVAAESGARVAISGAIPVCRHNFAHMAAAVAAFASMGAVAVALEVSPAAAASVGFSAALGAALDTGTVNGVWVSVTGVEAGDLPVSALHAVAPFVVTAVSA